MKEHNLNPKDFIIDEIESIELIGDKETVDICVEDTHMFYANDIYSHNSGGENEYISGESISDSFAKVMIADIVISLSRKSEDKVNGTGRFHFIKNRFGPDGITLPSKINMAIGDIQVFNGESDTGKELKKNMGENGEKKLLAQKYKELNINNNKKVDF